MDKLAEICATKREEVADRQGAGDARRPRPRARKDPPRPRGFCAALERKAAAGFGLIAEIKKASALQRPDPRRLPPGEHAVAYQQGGAACLSVLTDAPYLPGPRGLPDGRPRGVRPAGAAQGFHGRPVAGRRSPRIGADAILIIVAALADAEMAEIEAAALERGMDVLVEVHDAPRWRAWGGGCARG
jgi:indole-3-glycerol phosphate synthase